MYLYGCSILKSNLIVCSSTRSMAITSLYRVLEVTKRLKWIIKLEDTIKNPEVIVKNEALGRGL